MPSFFKRKPTLGELEENLEYKKTEHEIAQEEAAIAELKARGMRWQDFSTNGKRSGLNLSSIINWLKNH